MEVYIYIYIYGWLVYFMALIDKCTFRDIVNCFASSFFWGLVLPSLLVRKLISWQPRSK